MKEKRIKNCTSCETKYTVQWDIEEQDLEPLTCPFCGYEVEQEEDEEELWSNDSDSNEDDNWD
jgi:Zn ribbon nucleic-acid-binding protein